MSLSKVIEIARADLGYTEEPVNRTKYWEAYDPKMQGQPWCVACQWAWFNWAGEGKAFMGGGKTASCSTLYRWFKENYQSVPVREIAVGDLGFFNFSGGIAPEHCGLITHVERSGGSILYVKSIEGNTTTTGGSEDNGGVVAEKVRYPRNIVGAARPKYKTEEPEIVPDYTGRWSQKYWENGIELGIIDKAKDGKYRPKDNATREEVLAMIIRSREAKE